MDKRQQKTLSAIYEAFTKLVNTKDYDEISIQDILDASNVGRSTFYCHFKTKNDLLLRISQDIFDHVFSHSLQEEKSHDFSHENVFDYKHLITHIYYHVLDEKELIKGILSSKGNNVFMEEFRKHLYVLADSYFNNYPYINKDVPLSLKKDILVEDFISILKYWVNNNFQETPETLTTYYINVFKQKA